MAFTIDCEPNLITVHFLGELSVADLFGVQDRLADFESAQRTLPRLMDTTAVTGIRLDFMEMARFAQARRQVILPTNAKVAILAVRNVTFGFGRMYQDLLQHPQITLGVFRERQEALAWLGV